MSELDVVERIRAAERQRDEAREARDLAVEDARRAEAKCERLKKRLASLEGAAWQTEEWQALRDKRDAAAEALGEDAARTIWGKPHPAIKESLASADHALAEADKHLWLADYWTKNGVPETGSRVFIRGHLVWLAWYPKRGRRCSFIPARRPDGWHLSIGLGPLWLGLGPGTPAA